MSSCRLLVLGLDSMPPALAFEHLASVMPCLTGLCRGGASGPLRSTDPPITIPAWISLLSGRDPGELGLYGFRKPRPGTYETDTATSRDVAAPLLWDLASEAGLRSVVIGVPPSYPVRAPAGCVMTGCFLTPSSDSPWIDPPHLRQPLEAACGAYLVDVEAHRSDDRRAILAGALAVTAQRHALLRELARRQDPHLVAMVDIAPDRLHHGLLASIDPGHPRRRAGDPLIEPCLAYYAALDRELERTIDAVGADTVLICSDHGVQPLEGGLCLNDWLVERGDLVLRQRPRGPTPLSRLEVDWDRTKAYGFGGHYGRLCLNLEGREPRGTVSEQDAPVLLDELQRDLEAMTDGHGRRLSNRVLRPQELYREVRGLPPDLMIYADDLRLRALGTVGHGQTIVEDNDTGADEANHALYGIYVATGAGASDPALAPGMRLDELFGWLRRRVTGDAVSPDSPAP